MDEDVVELMGGKDKIEKEMVSDFVDVLIKNNVFEPPNKIRNLKCEKCESTDFSFKWKYHPNNEMGLQMCHDGFGFQLEDAIVQCSRCGISASYEKSDFLYIEEDKDYQDWYEKVVEDTIESINNNEDAKNNFLKLMYNQWNR